MAKCRINPKRTPVYLKSIESGSSFVNSIPATVRDEITYIVDRTKKTGNEQSLTFCKLEGKDKIYVGDYSVGDRNGTEVKPCRSAYGRASKVGECHTHPSGKDTVGTTPSTADITSTITDSAATNTPQVSCITSNEAKFIHCYQPKVNVINDYDKLAGYKSVHRHFENGVTDVHPYLRQHVREDFHHSYYDRKTFKRVKHPTPKNIIHDAFGGSRGLLKSESVPDLDKGLFCQLIEDLTYPTRDNGVYEECRRVLRINNFLGIRY